MIAILKYFLFKPSYNNPVIFADIVCEEIHTKNNNIDFDEEEIKSLKNTLICDMQKNNFGLQTYVEKAAYSIEIVNRGYRSLLGDMYEDHRFICHDTNHNYYSLFTIKTSAKNIEEILIKLCNIFPLYTIEANGKSFTRSLRKPRAMRVSYVLSNSMKRVEKTTSSIIVYLNVHDNIKTIQILFYRGLYSFFTIWSGITKAFKVNIDEPTCCFYKFPLTLMCDASIMVNAMFYIRNTPKWFPLVKKQQVPDICWYYQYVFTTTKSNPMRNIASILQILTRCHTDKKKTEFLVGQLISIDCDAMFFNNYTYRTSIINQNEDIVIQNHSSMLHYYCYYTLLFNKDFFEHIFKRTFQLDIEYTHIEIKGESENDFGTNVNYLEPTTTLRISSIHSSCGHILMVSANPMQYCEDAFRLEIQKL